MTNEGSEMATCYPTRLQADGCKDKVRKMENKKVGKRKKTDETLKHPPHQVCLNLSDKVQGL